VIHEHPRPFGFAQGRLCLSKTGRDKGRAPSVVDKYEKPGQPPLIVSMNPEWKDLGEGWYEQYRPGQCIDPSSGALRSRRAPLPQDDRIVIRAQKRGQPAPLTHHGESCTRTAREEGLCSFMARISAWCIRASRGSPQQGPTKAALAGLLGLLQQSAFHRIAASSNGNGPRSRKSGETWGTRLIRSARTRVRS